MSFNADNYLAAAQAHVTAARSLYRGRHYVMANYVAGLAAECLLRAYRFRRDPAFDSRHDLYMLYRASGLAGYVAEDQKYRVNSLLQVLGNQWRNDHRYRSKLELKRYLTRLGLHRGLKGDVVKESARRAVAAAVELIDLGVQTWPDS